MIHFVVDVEPGVIGVAYPIPGTRELALVTEANECSRRAMLALARRLTAETAATLPKVPTEDRRVPKGFYDDGAMT